MSGRRSPRARLALSAMALAACSTTTSSTTPAPSTTGTTAATAATATTATPTTATARTTTVTATSVAPASDFAASVAPVPAGDLGASWRDGCPLAPEELRLVRLDYWGFDDAAHEGSLVVNVAVTDAVIEVFRRLYDERFPIRRMEPVDVFGADDNASMAADNTSAFNCRPAVAPGQPRWSAHSYGEAIDVNPVENPYLLGGEVLPPGGATYVDRSDVRTGMAVEGSALTEAFAAVGWSWGGTWSSPDYQHFSATDG